MARVSIIIPSYNAANLLEETLLSLQKQVFRDWECLVVDDGSTDNTKEIVDSFTGKDSRYKYYYQANAGPSAARNNGIIQSKGEYIQFLDSDDMIGNNKLLKQVEILDSQKEYDIVYGNSCYFQASKDGEPLQIIEEDPNWQRKVSGKGDKIISTILHGNIMVVHSPLVRKTIFDKIGLWDDEIMFNEDWDVWTRCALQNIGFLFDDSPNTKALIRTHAENRSKALYKMYLNGLKVCIKVNNLVKMDSYKKILKLKIIDHQKFLEKEIVIYLRSEKAKSLMIAESMFQITKFQRYNIYRKLVESAPEIVCKGYYLWNYILNTLKYRITNAA